MLEAENESHVNRLTREITALRATQADAQAEGSSVVNTNGHRNGISSVIPPQGVMLEAMTRENEALRGRL